MKGSKVTGHEPMANIPGKDDKGMSYHGKDGNKRQFLRDIEGARRRLREKVT